MDVKKYTQQFILPPERCMDWAEQPMVKRAPVWCSVDLRDGNQALIEPMGLETKVEFFHLLTEIGFKEIEVGFPAASETEYAFVRALIERDLIPDDVTIQVLTQAREHIIKKTFEAIQGAEKVIVHVYNSTSVAQREQVFRKSKEEIRQIAVDGAQLLKELTDAGGGEVPVRVLARELYGDGAGVCPRRVQCGARGLAADGGQKGGHQPARHGGKRHAARLCAAGGVSSQAPVLPRERRALAAPAQRPRNAASRRRSSAFWRARTGWRGRSSATASARATATSSRSP